MSEKIEMNSFQLRCASQLMQALLEDGRLGFKVTLQKGNEENWIEIELSDHITKLWINPDSAQWIQKRNGEEWQQTFEWQEFKANFKALIEAFISHVVENMDPE